VRFYERRAEPDLDRQIPIFTETARVAVSPDDMNRMRYYMNAITGSLARPASAFPKLVLAQCRLAGSPTARWIAWSRCVHWRGPKSWVAIS